MSHVTRIRAVQPSDLATIRHTRTDWDIARETIGRAFPITPANEQRWYESLGEGHFPLSAVWTITADEDEDAIGLVQITEIDWVHRTGWFGIWIAPTAQGRGHGTRATELALAFAHHRMNLRQVRLRVVADNHRAIATYARTGWAEEGRLEGAVLEGGDTRDLILMRHDAR